MSAPIWLLGDSQLIIRMLLGVYKKVRKPSLYINIEGIRGIVRERWWKVAFRAVPRQLNALADNMCRGAEAMGRLVEFRMGSLPGDAPPL